MSNSELIKVYSFTLSDRSVLSRYSLNKVPKACLFFVHGSMEDSSIFISANFKKGIVSFLTRKGYDCWCLDLPGKKDTIEKKDQRGQEHVISKTIPECFKFINESYSFKLQQIWMGHSWGGVLLASAYARYSVLFSNQVKGLVLFSSKRRITVKNMRRYFFIDFMWNKVMALANEVFEYAPIKKLKFGPSDETYTYFKEVTSWLGANDLWVGDNGSVDYNSLWATIDNKPKLLSITGRNDHYLGHPQDCNLLLREMCYDQEVQVLSKANGNLLDYDHINILVGKEARQENFPMVEQFIRSTIE